MEPADVKSSTYFDFNKANNKENPNFEVANHVRISKYRDIFSNRYQIGQKKFLWLKKFKILCREHMLLVILTVKKLLERFTKKNCRKKMKKSLDLRK